MTATAHVHRHALAEAAAAFIGSLILSQFLILLFIAGRAVNFLPIKVIDAVNGQVVQLVTLPMKPIEKLPDKFRPVVLIDINDETLKRYCDNTINNFNCSDCNFVAGQSTPRDLLAALINRARDANPSAIFLDIDLRDPRNVEGDKALVNELQRTSPFPVLIPRVIFPQQSSTCATAEPIFAATSKKFRTIVPEEIGSGSVQFVHSYIEHDTLGNVKGICTHLRRPTDNATAPFDLTSGAALAVSIARPDLQVKIGAEVGLHRIQFRVVASTDAADGGHIFFRVPAHQLMWSDTPSSLAFMKDSIVIVGATHSGSEDEHYTALGTMPGALVHANAAIQLQLGDVAAPSHAEEWLAELAICMLLAGIYAYFYVYRGALAIDQRKNRASRLWSRLKSFVSIAILSIIIAMLYYVVVVRYLFPNASEFAIIAPVIAIFAELLYEALGGLKQTVEQLVRRVVNNNPG